MHRRYWKKTHCRYSDIQVITAMLLMKQYWVKQNELS